jgi:hypothetical protein
VGLAINPQVPPQLRQLAMQMVEGGTILMRRILDAYGIQDAKRLVPAIEEIMGNGQQQLNSIQGALGAGAGQPPGYAGQPGLGPVPPGFGGAMQTGLPQFGQGAGFGGMPAFAG